MKKMSKKEICRRRRIVAVTIIMALIISIVGMIKFFKSEYRYSNIYRIIYNTKIQYCKAEEIPVFESTEDLKETFLNAKVKVFNSSIRRKYPYLDWNRLENTKVCVSEDFFDPSILAMYNPMDNEVLVPPLTIAYYKDEALERILIHECIHALSNDDMAIPFMESFAEIITEKVCIEYNMPFDFTYTKNVRIYKMIEKVLSPDEMVYLLYNNEIDKKINEYTNGRYELLAVCSIRIEYFDLKEKHEMLCQKTIEEIVAHLAANMNLDFASRGELWGMFYYDDKYFLNILFEK